MSVASNLLAANTSGVETDTSGWTAGANTTLSKSTRYYQGASSLGMTATAAGSVTATTSARVAVTAGQEYTAYAFFANITSVAGRVATVRVDWYAAVSGGSSLGNVVSAGATLATATTWNTPPPILIGTAPAGANYASVTLTVTGLAAGAGVASDTISFGPPALAVGNLHSYGTQGLEVDTSGWVASAGCTLSRSTTSAYEGWYSLQAVSTVDASGTMFFRTGPLIPVVEGQEYVSLAYIRTAHVGVPVLIQTVWFTDAGVSIGTRSSHEWIPDAASTWTRITTVGRVPAGATHARTYLAPQATAVGQVWLFDQVTLRPAPTPAGSLIAYNVQSMELDASAWTAVSGCTINRSTDYAWDGSASLRITPASSGVDATVSFAAPAPVSARQAYTVTAQVRMGASAVSRAVTTRLTWSNAAGEDIRFLDVRWSLNPSGGGWYTIPTSAAAPDDATGLRYAITVHDAEPAEPVYLDDVRAVPGGVAVIADPIPDHYGASVALQGLTTGGYSRWGLWRVAADGALVALRGATGDTADMPVVGDSAIVEDFEAPLGVELYYHLRLWTPNVGGRATASDPITIPEPPSTVVVLKDPGLPARQTTAVVAKGGQPQWSRKSRQSVNAVRGRSRPVVISDVRTSREGSMTLITETAEELAAMWWLLETGNTILIQWPSLWGEKDMYVAIGDVTEAPLVEYAEYSDRTWTVPLTEVDRPIGGATGSAGRTWQTVLTDHTDGLDILATYTSWLGLLTGVEGT